MEMSRRSVPYTPLWKPLNGMKFALVTTAGVHLKSQEPFNLEGDESYRLLPGDMQAADLMVTHPSYDHADADQDINCVFPIDRLRELVTAGVIGGVANKHIGYMGYSNRLKKVYEETVPAMARELERSNADGVILTAG